MNLNGLVKGVTEGGSYLTYVKMSKMILFKFVAYGDHKYNCSGTCEKIIICALKDKK
jgi:hypothetical protein